MSPTFTNRRTQAVLQGLAPDGGLYIPESIPKLAPNWEQTWKTLNFQDLSYEILSLYIKPTEIPSSDLQEIIKKSYQGWRSEDITPLVKLSDDLRILELFHGPTYAFKDVALQFLGNLFSYFLSRPNSKQKRLTIVGATSGDTGSAAIYGLRSKPNISIFILHPKGKISSIQEAQMTTVSDANVHNIAVQNSSFDTCQSIVKSLFSDEQFREKWNLGAVNSINWARILAQMVYYFHAYLRVGKGKEVEFVVPTGNFGDVLAGYYAKKMGLPISRLVIATNENDILSRFWNDGVYEQQTVKETPSPAMDIVVSSNFERLLFYLAGEDSELVRRWMDGMKEDGKVPIQVEVLERARKDFSATRVSNEEVSLVSDSNLGLIEGQTYETIKKYYEQYGYVADPHTTVALKAAETFKREGVIQVVLSTAHPAKFSESVQRSLGSYNGFNFERDVLPEEFKALLSLPRRVISLESPSVEKVKKIIEDNTQD